MSMEGIKGSLAQESRGPELPRNQKRFEIIGEAASDELRRQFYQNIIKERQEALQPLEHEEPKEHWHMESIRVINNLLQEKARELAIENDLGSIQPEQIHIVSKSMFAELNHGRDAVGMARIVSNAAYIIRPFTLDEVIYWGRNPDADEMNRMIEDRLNEDSKEGYLEDIDTLYEETFGQKVPPDVWDEKDEDQELNSEEQEYMDFWDKERDRQHTEAEAAIKEELVEESQEDLDREHYLFFSVVLHESVHLAAIERYYIDDEIGDGHLARGGYEVHNPYRSFYKEFLVEQDVAKTSRHYPGYFQSLNEAVVQKITVELVEKNDEQVRQAIKAHGLPRDLLSYDFDLDRSAYAKDIELLNRIVQKVAEYKQEAFEETWRRFQRHHFTGNLSHLRDVERACGSGTLRLYSTIRANDTQSIHLMMEYLQQSDIATREHLAEKIFQTTKAYSPSFADHQKAAFLKRKKQE